MKRSRGQNRIAFGTVALGAVVLVAAGAAGGMLVAPEPVPGSVAAESSAATAPVSMDVFDDARMVKVNPVLSEGSVVDLALAGTVTASSCVPGTEIASGTSPVTVDDTPVVALATTVPLWRDLTRGVKGEDVESLQSELVRLGYDVDSDGTFGWGTRAAVVDLQESIGIAKPSGALSPSQVLWLPASTVSVSSCDLSLGDSAPAPFATVAGTLDGVRLGVAPSLEADGGRVLASGDVTAAVDEDGTVTDSDFLAAVSESEAFRGWQRTDGEVPLNLEYRLAEPLDVAVVPPGAVYGIAGTRGCVASDGDSYPVTIVASSLGQTSVTFDDGAAPAVVNLTSQGGSASC